jgi:hypothetical protein
VNDWERFERESDRWFLKGFALAIVGNVVVIAALAAAVYVLVKAL